MTVQRATLRILALALAVLSAVAGLLLFDGPGGQSGAPVGERVEREARSTSLTPLDAPPTTPLGQAGGLPQTTSGPRTGMAGVPEGLIVTRSAPARTPDPAPQFVTGLPSGMGVRGRVLDELGLPVLDAKVSLIMRPATSASWQGPLQSVAAGGWFDLRITMTAPGRDLGGMHLSVEAPGRTPVHAQVVPAGGESVVTMSAATVREVQILLEDGTPLAGAEVIVSQPFPSEQRYFRGEPSVPARVQRTDAQGRVTVAPWGENLVLDVSHPEHSSAFNCVLPPGQDLLTVHVARARHLRVELLGQVQLWRERGLLPDLRLFSSGRGGLTGGRRASWRPPAERATPPSLTHAWFHNLPEGMLRPYIGLDDQQVLEEIGAIEPGINEVRVHLPPPPTDSPANWWLPLQVVDTSGQVLRDEYRFWGVLPPVALIDADGAKLFAPVGDLSNGLAVTLRPPVSARFSGHDDGPRVDGMTADRGGQLVVDDTSWPAATASVRVDLSAIDPALWPTVLLVLQREPGVSGQVYSMPVARGLSPGNVDWSLSGTGVGFHLHQVVAHGNGQLQLRAGEEHVIIAQPRDQPVDVQPGASYAMLKGRVVLVSDDPWVELLEVRYEALDERAAILDEFDGNTPGPHTLLGGQFRGAVSPGRYRVTATALRLPHPELQLADRSDAVDPHLTRTDLLEHLPVFLIGEPKDITLESGNSYDLELQLDARDQGLLFITGSIGGAPIGENSSSLVLQITDTASGKLVGSCTYGWLPKDGVSWALPPGVYLVSGQAMGLNRATSDDARVVVEVPSSRSGLAALVHLSPPAPPAASMGPQPPAPVLRHDRR